MANDKLLIPAKLKVGFQKRSDTYTGSLAYVIYFDNTGTLRKEKSWTTWRDETIDPVEYENKPTEGFVLNKKVGGYKSDWNFRDSHIRVYDPRGFEFEISVANLLFILRECDCSRGRGLEGKFVYAWEGTELYLLPVNSEEYKKSSEFTDLQGKGVKAKDLIEGATYVTKQQKGWTYLGRRMYFGNDVSDPSFEDNYRDTRKTAKLHIFWDGEHFHVTKDVKALSVVQSEDCHQDYASLVDKYEKSVHGSKIKRLFLQEVPEKANKGSRWSERWYIESAPGVFWQCQSLYPWTGDNNVDCSVVESWESNYDISLQDGAVVCKHVNTRNVYSSYGHWYDNCKAYPPKSGKKGGIPWREPTNDRLFAEMESGSIVRIRD